ncbi:MAG TPA: hypothetical protein VIR54_25500 [Vicinamibacterales bacterium]
MRHVAAIVAALTLVAFAGVIVWYNRTALTAPLLIAAGSCLVLALALAIPSDFRAALASVAPYVPMMRGGNPPADPPSGGAS